MMGFNYQSAARPEKMLPTITQAEALARMPNESDATLMYTAWPACYSSTSGPFNGIAGQAFSTFTMEAWLGHETAMVFCNGKVVSVMPVAKALAHLSIDARPHFFQERTGAK